MIADLFAAARQRRNAITTSTPGVLHFAGSGAGPPTVESAQQLSAVFAAVEIRSNAMSVLPAYVMDRATKERPDHDILRLLDDRPNEAMSPSVRKKLLSRSVDLLGNAYDWIIRDPRSGRPVELIPLPGNLVRVWLDDHRRAWYDVTDPVTGEVFRLPGEDVCHYKGPSRNGYTGLSILSYARETIQAALAAQRYNTQFYETGGQPAGVLTVDTDLGGYENDKNGNPTDVTKKEAVRREWERVHSGPTNAHRVAVLDHGMKYQPLAISKADSQFVEQMGATVEDIARFFSVPLYKLQSGKQSYNSNEQNAIEFVETALHPRVSQNEEEQTYKLLLPSDRLRGLEIRYNMMAALRADSAARVQSYRGMRELGAYSVNDILELEDRPAVEGGDERLASLNYVPLSDWKRLSLLRNGGEKE